MIVEYTTDVGTHQFWVAMVEIGTEAREIAVPVEVGMVSPVKIKVSYKDGEGYELTVLKEPKLSQEAWRVRSSEIKHNSRTWLDW